MNLDTIVGPVEKFNSMTAFLSLSLPFVLTLHSSSFTLHLCIIQFLCTLSSMILAFLPTACRAPARLELAGWGSEPGGGEGHGGCYDNFIMVFDRWE